MFLNTRSSPRATYHWEAAIKTLPGMGEVIEVRPPRFHDTVLLKYGAGVRFWCQIVCVRARACACVDREIP